MGLPSEPGDIAVYLGQLHDADRPQLEAYDAYYELEQPLAYMHPELLAEVHDRIRPVLIAWPQLVVDSVEERLDVEGFALPDEDTGDDEMWRVWQANDLDEESQLAHIDALVMGRSYVAVGTNEDDEATPLVTVESPLEMFAHIDPRTRRVDAALRRWRDTDSYARALEEYATLYLPDVTIWYDRGSGAWREIDRDEHKVGQVLVAPIVNRARLSSRPRMLYGPANPVRWANGRGMQLAGRYGRSDLAPVVPLADAATKIATDMMVAAEGHALPLRAIFGIGPDDLKDQDGNQVTKMQAVMERLWTIDDPDAKAVQLDATSLSNYHSTITALAQLVASIAGLPPHYLGMTSENPTSADAIRSSEARLVKRAERKQRAFGGAWELVQRLVRRLQAGDVDPRLARLETQWRNASTPTIAQKADAVTKLHTEKIIDTEQAQEDLGYTDGQRQRMRDRRSANQINLGIGSLEAFANTGQPPVPGPPPGL
jgi:hypothetical protein